jgi:site-specific DNA-methyltransferase (adenine-specific)
VIHGDCADVLPGLTGVDAIITDPPWELSGNAIEIRGAGVAPRRQASKTLTKGIVGEWSEAIVRLCQQTATADCFFFAGYKELGKLCLACDPLRGVFAWHKPNGAPAAFYPAKMDLSFIVWTGRKSNLYGHQHWPSMVFSVPFPQAGCMASERIVDTTGKSVHPCQGPVALYARLMQPMPEGCMICDPYMGTGTTGVACIKSGRRFIGIERDAGHFALARERLTRELAQGLLDLGTHNSGIDMTSPKGGKPTSANVPPCATRSAT